MRSLLAVAFLLALALGTSAQSTPSVTELEMAVRSNPNSPEAWYKLGVEKFRYTWIDDAKLAFEKAIELKPDYEQAYVALGAWLLSKRRCALGSDLERRRAES